MRQFVLGGAALLLVLPAWPALAQRIETAPIAEPARGALPLNLPFAYDGPAPPELPVTMARDSEGKATVRAVRLTTPLRIDGQLDEAFYTETMPSSGLIQTEPHAGAAATDSMEFWVAFDDENVYFSARVGQSQPDHMVVNEMRRDSNQIFEGDHIAVAFDTFYDKRNSLMFYLNAIGGRADGQLNNESQYSGDWNPIWNFAVRRTPEGWNAETAIPFKSLRYRPGREQIWGMQIRRNNRGKNEITFLTPVPNGLARQAFFRTSRFATLVGIEAPPGSRALDVKPTVIAGLSTDVSAMPQLHNDVNGEFGLDLKYGVTRGLTGDFTYNTDFAQVEADEQQVNLTRFSLFFPEKRDFFLENQGIFNFGGAGGFERGDTPLLFYSRRIGLEQGRAIPIDAGGRLSGRVGAYSLGIIDIQTRDVDALGVPSTNFAVARIRRDILRRSAIGALATRRSSVTGRPGAAGTIGIDGSFAFFTNLTINTFWAKTEASGLHGDDTSHRAQLNYNHDRYGLQLERLVIGEHFNPEVGFLRRSDFRKNYGQVRFSPRPRSSRIVRKYWFQVSGDYYENRAKEKETQDLVGEFDIDFQNSDRLELSYRDGFELIPQPFRIARGVTVPTGGYDSRTFHGEFTLGQQHKMSGTFFIEQGPFYQGDRTAFGYNQMRVKFNPQFSIEPGLSVNHVKLPFGDFSTALVSSRVTYTMTPMMFVSGLLQYNSSNNSFSTNLRLRWEYRPGSELFIVFNENRDTVRHGFPDLQSRSFVIKANRLMRF